MQLCCFSPSRLHFFFGGTSKPHLVIMKFGFNIHKTIIYICLGVQRYHYVTDVNINFYISKNIVF